jgi:hypothetical protein
MDRVDDLGVVDPLEIDAGDPQIAMAELPLDSHQRHALVRELDSVRMPQLMRREPPADARRFRCATQMFASRGGLPAWIMQNSAPTGRVVRTSRYGAN